MEYLVELGTKIDKRVDSLANIYRLPYFEVCPSGGKKTGYSAVLGIIGFLNVPIVYFSVELWQGGLHPGIDTKMNMSATMQTAWLISWFALTLLYLFLLMFRYRAEQMKIELDTIQYQQMSES